MVKIQLSEQLPHFRNMACLPGYTEALIWLALKEGLIEVETPKQINEAKERFLLSAKEDHLPIKKVPREIVDSIILHDEILGFESDVGKTSLLSNSQRGAFKEFAIDLDFGRDPRLLKPNILEAGVRSPYVELLRQGFSKTFAWEFSKTHKYSDLVTSQTTCDIYFDFLNSCILSEPFLIGHFLSGERLTTKTKKMIWRYHCCRNLILFLLAFISLNQESDAVFKKRVQIRAVKKISCSNYLPIINPKLVSLDNPDADTAAKILKVGEIYAVIRQFDYVNEWYRRQKNYRREYISAIDNWFVP